MGRNRTIKHGNKGAQMRRVLRQEESFASLLEEFEGTAGGVLDDNASSSINLMKRSAAVAIKSKKASGKAGHSLHAAKNYEKDSNLMEKRMDEARKYLYRGTYRKDINPGDVFWVEKRVTYGNEIANPERRPAIVISSNERNSKLGIVQVVFLTTSPNHPDIPCYPKVEYKDPGICARESIALCDQICTVTTSFLDQKIGKISDECLHNVRYGINWSLGASDYVLDAIMQEKHSNKKAFVNREKHSSNGYREKFTPMAAVI